MVFLQFCLHEITSSSDVGFHTGQLFETIVFEREYLILFVHFQSLHRPLLVSQLSSLNSPFIDVSIVTSTIPHHPSALSFEL